MQIIGIRFRPRLAFARLGGANSPMDNYVWREDPTIHGSARNVLDPALSFDVLDDGSLLPFTPTVIRFREHGKLRPIAAHRVGAAQRRARPARRHPSARNGLHLFIIGALHPDEPAVGQILSSIN
jgi:hypothetical protein